MNGGRATGRHVELKVRSVPLGWTPLEGARYLTDHVVAPLRWSRGVYAVTLTLSLLVLLEIEKNIALALALVLDI